MPDLRVRGLATSVWERITIICCMSDTDAVMEQDSMLPMMGAFRGYMRDSLGV